MQYRIKHVTTYHYASAVSMCQNLARLSPMNSSRQTCKHIRFLVTPAPVSLKHRFDYFGNRATYFEIPRPHKELVVSVESEVQVLQGFQQSLFQEAESWEHLLQSDDHKHDPTWLQAQEFTLPSPLTPIIDGVRSYAKASFKPGATLLESVNDLNKRIYTDFTYDPAFTTISTPLDQVVKHKRGVCQDFAHFGIACVRAMGLPARYVSGYLETQPPPGEKKMVGTDASHAWFSVFSPGNGWIDFDPTNNLVPSEQHITLAVGRDFADVSPLKGVIYGGDQHDLQVSVDVSRMNR